MLIYRKAQGEIVIKWRFFKRFILIITFFIITLSLIAGKLFFDSFVTETVGKAKTVTQSFSVLFPVLQAGKAPALYQQTLVQFAKVHDVEFLYAADFEGRMIGFYSKYPDKKTILKNITAPEKRGEIVVKNIKINGKNLLQVSRPVPESGNQGRFFITAGFSKQQFEEDLAETAKITIIVFIFFVLIGLIVSLNTAGYFSKPIVSLTENVIEIGKGKLEKVPALNTHDELETLGNEINKMIGGLKEREFIKNTFQRYVTKEIAEELLGDPTNLELGGVEREVTIIFSDIRGFTRICENMSAVETVKFLNEYLKEMLDIIFKYEGTLDKFIGDSIMVLFGAPKHREDDANRAVKTALEMQERLQQVNGRRAAEGKVEINIGIGINTGKVIAGNIGDFRRMEYTVIGHNVNLASRLEQLTKKYGNNIIISESTYEKVKDFVEVKELGEVSIKGKDLPMTVYELIGLKKV
jgi:class 3 adenylate cyclase